MKNDFVREQEEVRTFIGRGKFDEAIKKSIKVLDGLDANDSHNKWFFNLRIAMCYRKKGQVKKL